MAEVFRSSLGSHLDQPKKILDLKEDIFIQKIFLLILLQGRGHSEAPFPLSQQESLPAERQRRRAYI